MTVLDIVTAGHPALRSRAREVEDIASVQRLVDDLIDTMRAANGAGLAANQVGALDRVAVVEVREGNPRYPYKPPIPLTVMINPVLDLSDDQVDINEGCLSVPGLRGEVPRSITARVRYLDRQGEPREDVFRGLSAGTFQHEVDHLDGILFLDRVADPRTFMTWEEFERRHKAAFLERVAGLPR